MNIGDRIKILREEANITQKELADILSVASSSIGMYETNQRQPSLDILQKIADYFNVTTDYLLGKEDDTISYAFEGAERGLTPEDIEDVKRYIEFVKSKRRK